MRKTSMVRNSALSEIGRSRYHNKTKIIKRPTLSGSVISFSIAASSAAE
jgi:hypothetical protein